MVTTLCLSGTAFHKAGKNCSADGKVFADEFINEAEGLVCADSKYNWITAYPTLLSGTKFFLNDVVSDLAAIELIKYDMSVYTSRIEAEDLINVLYAHSQSKREILQTQDKVKFLTTV
jgi:hypothetical protein